MTNKEYWKLALNRLDGLTKQDTYSRLEVTHLLQNEMLDFVSRVLEDLEQDLPKKEVYTNTEMLNYISSWINSERKR